MSSEIRITIGLTDGDVDVEVWCPAFVDQQAHRTVAEAVEWAGERLAACDEPFKAAAV